MEIILSIISLIVYFVWGQGTACAWWMWIPIVLLVISMLGSIKLLEWLISLFLLCVTFFAPPTFGYNDIQKAFYYEGYIWGKGTLMEAYDVCWNRCKDEADIDIDSYEKYYRYGFKRGAGSKED